MTMHADDATTTTLQRWLAEEAAVGTRQAAGAPQSVTPEQMAALTGLQQMQALLDGDLSPPSIGRTLDFLLVSVAHGHAIFQGTPGPGHLNPMGSVHGGWYATLLDSALGCSVHTGLPAGKGYTTLELKVNIVRALNPKVQRVRAEGRVIHLGGQTATAEARLVGPDGKLYAHGSTTCLVFTPPPAR
jgi:uncharacterized protein (TIGR00369 family)